MKKNNMEKRDRMTFHRTFREAIEEMPWEVQGYAYAAVLDYALDGIEPETLEGAEKATFEMMRPRLDADRERWQKQQARSVGKVTD